MPSAARRPLLATLRGAALALLVASCASIHVERDTLTSGSFESKGVALTLLSWDIPKPALDIARENAGDAQLAQMRIERSRVTPNLGAFDWLLDILGVRWARVSGTWGSDPGS